MKRSYNEGGITAFLSAVLLTLIVFSCALVDITRIHIAQIQAENVLRNSANSILASYDTMLAREYGLFSKDIKNTIFISSILDYANSSLKPEESDCNSNIITELIFPKNEKSFDIYDYNLEINEGDINIIETLAGENGIYNVKEQILDYMKYRAPLYLVEPFLEKLEVFQKTSKTSKLIKEKNQIVSKVKNVEESFLKLERIIDGIIIDTNKDEVKNNLFNNYIKRLYTTDVIETNIYTNKEIPNESIRDKLNENVEYIDITISDFITNLDECDGLIDKSIKIYRSYKELTDEKNDLVKRRSNISNIDESERYEKLTRKIHNKQEKIDEKLGELTLYATKFNNKYNSINDDLEKIELLTKIYMYTLNPYEYEGEYNVKNIFGYKGLNEEALKIITEIKNNAEQINKDISEFKNNIEKNKQEYIEITCEGVEQEVDQISNKLAIGDKTNLSPVNNVVAIEEVLKNNIIVLNNIDEPVSTLRPNLEKITSFWFSKNSNKEEEVVNKLLSMKNANGNHLFDLNKRIIMDNFSKSFIDNNLQNNIKNTLYIIEQELDNYERNIYFDYSNMEETESHKISLKKINNQADKFNVNIENNNYEKINSNKKNNELQVTSEFLPSLFLEKDNNIVYDGIKIRTKSVESSNNYLSIIENYSNKIVTSTKELIDNIYINEYIMGMFKSATYKYDDNKLTINNYDKNEHLLDYEVEYIIGGNKDQNKNLQKTIAIVFGIRVGCNIIHIVSNNEKRTLITNIANTIAGWWSLGIGAIVLVIIITLLWAVTESFVDISILMGGGKVPFIKTSSSWYTAIDGNWDDLINKSYEDAINIIENESIKYKNFAQKKVEKLGEKLSIESKTFLTNQIEDIYVEGYKAIEATCDEVDSIIDNAVNDAYGQIIEEGALSINTSKYFKEGSVGYIELEKILKEIEKQQYELEDKSLTNIICTKEKVLSKYEQNVGEIKNDVTNKIDITINNCINESVDEITKLIDKSIEEGKQIGIDKLKSEIVDLKKSIKNKTKKEDTLNNKGENLSEYIPSFSYNDYLRIILFASDEEEKIYRTLDLIQMNIQKKANNKDVLFVDYITKFTVTGNVSIKYLFYNLPFMPQEAKDVGSGRYRFKVCVTVQY